MWWWGGGGLRQLNEAPRGRKKRRRVAHLSVSKYSIFSCPAQPLVFVMVPFSINKDVNMRGGVSGELWPAQTFVWRFEE